MGRIHNIEGKKNKMDSLRSNVFTKHARAISVAARQGGGNPDYNAALKLAIQKAKADNMPNDNINRAIKKGTGEDGGANYEQITYEGYGPGGIAMIIEVLTDNKNRAAGNVRYYLDRNGGNLGTAGSVSYMFERKGQILIAADDDVNEDELMEAALEAGAEDVVTNDDGSIEVLTGPNEFPEVRHALEAAGFTPEMAEVTMKAETDVEFNGADAEKMQRLLDALENLDDVQNVYTNAVINEDD